jgi:hypothetical protein
MHMQLPGTLLDQIDMGANEVRPVVPEPKAVALDRLVFNRAGRKVKFYFRLNRCKRCYSDLTDEQVKALTASLKNIGKTGNLVFDNDVYFVSPRTKRLVK